MTAPTLFFTSQERLCEHFSHNASAGCGNPTCWKYLPEAYDKLVEDQGIVSRERFEKITITEYLEALGGRQEHSEEVSVGDHS